MSHIRECFEHKPVRSLSFLNGNRGLFSTLHSGSDSLGRLMAASPCMASYLQSFSFDCHISQSRNNYFHGSFIINQLLYTFKISHWSEQLKAERCVNKYPSANFNIKMQQEDDWSKMDVRLRIHNIYYIFDILMMCSMCTLLFCYYLQLFRWSV